MTHLGDACTTELFIIHFTESMYHSVMFITHFTDHSVMVITHPGGSVYHSVILYCITQPGGSMYHSVMLHNSPLSFMQMS